MKFVAVTACPTGIAHSQMAAENLRQVATAAGHDIEVEIQGAMGTQNELAPEAIEAADAVVVAADTAIEGDERFAHKPVVDRPVGDAVTDAERVLRAAVEAADAAKAVDTAEATDTVEPTEVASSGGNPADDELTDADADENSQETESLSERLAARLRRLL